MPSNAILEQKKQAVAELADLIKASLPFVGVMYLVLLMITMFPDLILFVPNMLG